MRQDLASWCRANGEHELAQIVSDEADDLLRRFNLPSPPQLAPVEADPFRTLIKREIGDCPVIIPGRWETLQAVWEDRLKHLHSQVEQDKTLGAGLSS